MLLLLDQLHKLLEIILYPLVMLLDIKLMVKIMLVSGQMLDANLVVIIISVLVVVLEITLLIIIQIKELLIQITLLCLVMRLKL